MRKKRQKYKIVEQGVISLNDRLFDLFDLFHCKDNEGKRFFYGQYEIEGKGLIISASRSKGKLTHNMSNILSLRTNFKFHHKKVKGVDVLNSKILLN